MTPTGPVEGSESRGWRVRGGEGGYGGWRGVVEGR